MCKKLLNWVKRAIGITATMANDNNLTENESSKKKASHKVWCPLIAVMVIILFVCLFPVSRDFVLKYICEVTFIVAVFIVFLMLGYYLERLSSRSHKESSLYSIGHDLSKIISWLFSVQGLFTLLVCAVMFLVWFMITNATSLSRTKESDVLQLLTVTLTVTLSTLIPTLVSRMVSKKQLHEFVEQKVDTEIEKYKTSLNEIRKDKGHSCRMSATLLEQWAHSNRNANNSTDYAAWSIGWAASAIIQYLLIMPQYENARKNSAYCLNLINKAANDIRKTQPTKVKYSDFQSLITMHALMVQYNLILTLQTEAIAMRDGDQFDCNGDGVGIVNWDVTSADFDTIFKEIESWLYDRLKEEDKRSVRPGFCQITGLSKDSNDQLDQYVMEIIKNITKSKEKGE